MNLRLQKKLGAVSLEYPCVIETSSNPQWLLESHRRPLTKLECVIMVGNLAIKHKWPVDMRFTAKCRSRGGTKNYKPWLKLNEHRLSVGLVLHEFAHVIQYMTLKGSQPHGIEFVRILDNLVSEYFMHQV